MGSSNNPTQPDIMQLFLILALAACAAAAPSPNKNKKFSTMNLDVYPEKTPVGVDIQTVDRKQAPLDTVQGSKVNLLRRKRGAQQIKQLQLMVKPIEEVYAEFVTKVVPVAKTSIPDPTYIHEDDIIYGYDYDNYG